MQAPLFSIIVTSYNREKYIAETLDSILSQSFSNYELILVDDCSTDETFKIAKSYKNKFNKITFHQNAKNIGQFNNRNFGASLAKGEYILYVDSDDSIKNGTLTYLDDVVSKYKDVGFFLVNKMQNINGCIMLSPQEAYRHHFFKKSILHIGPGGTLVKRILFEKNNGFPTRYGAVGDMYYNLFNASNTDIVLLDFDFLNYRRHDNQELNKAYDYLIYGYLYFLDILSLPNLPLAKNECKSLINKSKRRFIFNAFHYALKNRSPKVLIDTFRSVRFTFSDFIIALYA
jgi:glycosyltransferase involved in cell wall biosynthesis